MLIVQSGKLDITAAPVVSDPTPPELIQTGVLGNVDDGVETSLWATLTGVLGALISFFIGNRNRRTV